MAIMPTLVDTARAPSSPPLVEVEDLRLWYPIKRGIRSRVVGYVKAVDGVSFTIPRGKTLGLVGESGCGKTSVARAVLYLVKPTGGSVRFDGIELGSLSPEALRRLRPRMQIIFQDPYSSLNPRRTVMEIVGEAMAFHKMWQGEALQQRVLGLLERVGLEPAHALRFPHEFSGGQRQRIGIARALAMNPELIVADEPVSALDVSIQSQILNLLLDLRSEYGVTYLFIAHGLHVVAHVSDIIGVMYLGKLVELAEADELYYHPAHPYTKALISAVPVPDPTVRRERIILEGDVPSPVNPPPGCRFQTRCPFATARCRTEEPLLHDVGGGHLAACHLV